MRKPLITFLLLLAVNPALAVEPDEILKDPALEARARAISAGLRCVVCDNQSLDESDAPVAKDLRQLIREQLSANKTDEEIVDHIVARFGEYVLLKPRFHTGTAVLWLAPFLILAASLLVFFRRTRIVPSQPGELSDTEKAELDSLLRK